MADQKAAILRRDCEQIRELLNAKAMQIACLQQEIIFWKQQLVDTERRLKEAESNG